MKRPKRPSECAAFGGALRVNRLFKYFSSLMETRSKKSANAVIQFDKKETHLHRKRNFCGKNSKTRNKRRLDAEGRA